MSLPESRNTTYTTSDPPKSNDLNELQDCVIEGKHGELIWTFQPATGTYDNCSYDGANNYLEATGAPWSWYYPLYLPAGITITDITFGRFGTGAGSLSLTLRSVSAGAVGTDIDTELVVSPAAAWTDTSLILAATTTAALSYKLYITGSTIGQLITCLRLTGKKL